MTRELDDAGADGVRSILASVIVGGSLTGDLHDALHYRRLVITHGAGECI